MTYVLIKLTRPNAKHENRQKQAFFNIYIIFTENSEKVEKFNQVQDSPKTHEKQSCAEMKNRNVIDRRFVKILKLTPEMTKT